MRTASRIARTSLALVAGLSPLLLAGCLATTVSPTFDVAQGEYARAFDVAAETLREYRFKVDRVDAAAGVISTFPKTTSGLATPWDAEQSTPMQEVEDLVAFNSRTVRITFNTNPGRGAAEGAEAPSNQFQAGAVVGRIDVVVQRRYVRGWRISPAAILQSDFTYDTLAGARGQAQQYDAPITRDERLAARLASRIQARLGAFESSSDSSGR